MANVVRLNLLGKFMNSCIRQTHISRNIGYFHAHVCGPGLTGQQLWRQMSSSSSSGNNSDPDSDPPDNRNRRYNRDGRNCRDWRNGRNNRSSSGHRRRLPKRDEEEDRERMPPTSFIERRTPFRVISDSSGDNATSVRMHPRERSLTAEEEEEQELEPESKLPMQLPLLFTMRSHHHHHHPMPLEKAMTMRPYQVQRREAQLARTLNSYDYQVFFKPCIPLPGQVYELSSRLGTYPAIRDQRISPYHPAIESMRNRNMERMMRESQARLATRQVAALCGEQERNLEGIKALMATAVNVRGPGTETILPNKWEWARQSFQDGKRNMEADTMQSLAMLQMLRRAIINGMADKGAPTKFRDLRVSKMNNKLEWNGLRPCRKNTDPFGVDRINDTVDRARMYHMLIICARSGPRNPKSSRNRTNMSNCSCRDGNRSTNSCTTSRISLINRIRRNICLSKMKMINSKPKYSQFKRLPLRDFKLRAVQHLPITSNLVKDEQKRLDKLKAAKVHLQVLQDSIRNRRSTGISSPSAIPLSSRPCASQEKTKMNPGDSQAPVAELKDATVKRDKKDDEKDMDKKEELITKDMEPVDPTDLAPK
ncbi:uncharacterized protein Dana_GF22545 [Drosophila ananassae]|uniref:Uncharacterized protein n=1 Tax=Drosophila ananassae TaxID=7217 RepID=B3MVQ9_DROAN|nr:uncharacterized protein LOC6505202 [Drosophila ananassae]EDV35054.2 uncharacterized protein Dana_GF22545 [Drosophila ananassae]